MNTIVITGASSGIGRAAALALSERGWQVAVVGRDPERTAAVSGLVGGTPFVADFDRLDDVRRLADALLTRFPRIDVLANNAGGLVGRRGLSADGHERTIQLNHYAPFLLTNLLLPRLIASGARIVNTASVANRFGRVRLADLDGRRRPYLGGWGAYATAKLATVLFTRELAARTPLDAYSFHPGFVSSAFGSDSRGARHLIGLGSSRQISSEQGALPLVQLASGPALQLASGTYFDGLYPGGAVGRQAGDRILAARLWDASAAAVGLA